MKKSPKIEKLIKLFKQSLNLAPNAERVGGGGSVPAAVRAEGKAGWFSLLLFSFPPPPAAALEKISSRPILFCWRGMKTFAGGRKEEKASPPKINPFIPYSDQLKALLDYWHDYFGLFYQITWFYGGKSSIFWYFFSELARISLTVRGKRRWRPPLSLSHHKYNATQYHLH